MEGNRKANGSKSIFCRFCFLMINVKGQIPSGEDCFPGWSSSYSRSFLQLSLQGNRQLFQLQDTKCNLRQCKPEGNGIESRSQVSGNRTCSDIGWFRGSGTVLKSQRLSLFLTWSYSKTTAPRLSIMVTRSPTSNLIQVQQELSKNLLPRIPTESLTASLNGSN